MSRKFSIDKIHFGSTERRSMAGGKCGIDFAHVLFTEGGHARSSRHSRDERLQIEKNEKHQLTI